MKGIGLLVSLRMSHVCKLSVLCIAPLPSLHALVIDVLGATVYNLHKGSCCMVK